MKIRWMLGLSVLCTLLVISVSNLFAEKTWTPRADMPTARYNFDTCIVDGKVFAIGGEIEVFGVGGSSAAVRGPLTTVEVYGTGEAPQSVDPAGKLLKTWGAIKTRQ